MRLLTLNNKEVSINIHRYRVDWEKPCRSKFQFNVKKFLETYIKTHVVVEEMKVPHSRLRLDLCDLTTKICYETNGNQHREYNKFFTNNSRANYLQMLRNDGSKAKWCEINNITLVEIYPEDKLDRVYFEEKFGISL